MCKNVDIFLKFTGSPRNTKTSQEYWIQQITAEYTEQVLHHLIEGYLLEEPLAKYLNVRGCKGSVGALLEIYREACDSKIPLICLTLDQNGEPELVGFNITVPIKKGYKPEPHDGAPNMNKMFGIVSYVMDKKDIYAEIEEDEILSSYAMYVLPNHRGNSVGCRFLEAREKLCKKLQLRYSAAIFTSKFSQASSEKAGYVTVCSVEYEQIFKERPDLYVPNITEHTKTCTAAYKEYY